MFANLFILSAAGQFYNYLVFLANFDACLKLSQKGFRIVDIHGRMDIQWICIQGCEIITNHLNGFHHCIVPLSI